MLIWDFLWFPFKAKTQVNCLLRCEFSQGKNMLPSETPGFD